MLYTLIAVLVGLIALYVAYRALHLLAIKSWFIGFCRGLFGLGLLLVAGAIALVAYDVYSYKQILQEQTIATLSFDQIEPQYFEVRLVGKDGTEQHFKLRGDQWQLDARIVKWQGYIATLGVKPAYRLERLSGRYFDIEQETQAPRTAYALDASLYGMDVWKWLNKYPDWVPAIDTIYGSATYLPLKDKALFEVTLSHTGLLARPLNDVAREAVNSFR